MIKNLLKEFFKSGYTYKGVYKDCKMIINICSECIQKRKKYYKRKPTKQIIFAYQNERIWADLKELPYELKYNNNYQYPLNIIDPIWCYLLTNKKSNNVFKYINDCFNIIGFPEQFTNNGKKFANDKMKNKLAENNVKFIHGKAFSPCSQGCVEKLHHTLKIKLLCKKLDDGIALIYHLH